MFELVSGTQVSFGRGCFTLRLLFSGCSSAMGGAGSLFLPEVPRTAPAAIRFKRDGETSEINVRRSVHIPQRQA